MHLHRLALLAAAFGAAMFAGQAQAAVSVFGPGPAQMCFQAADAGLSPAMNMIYCNEALSGPLSPDDRAATYVNRGVLRLAMFQADQATADFNAGIALNANIGECYVDLGAADILNKRYEDAVGHITKGLALGTKEPQNAYYDRAIANEASGHITAAYHDYQQALSLAPGFDLAAQQLKRFKVVEKPSGT